MQAQWHSGHLHTHLSLSSSHDFVTVPLWQVQDAKLAADVETMISWGMASLKVDGCNADFAAMNVTYPKLGAALEAAAKKAGKPSPWHLLRNITMLCCIGTMIVAQA